MSSYGKAVTLAISLSGVMACRNGEAAPNPDEMATLSPEVFSHTDPAVINDQACLGGGGVLITANGIGPVTVGTTLSRLRKRCQIAMVKVPSSMAIQGPVLGVSVGGGLILFTVSSKDSLIETAVSSSPAYRTSNGIGVGTPVRGLSYAAGRICFKHDSTRVTSVVISRHPITCG